MTARTYLNVYIYIHIYAGCPIWGTLNKWEAPTTETILHTIAGLLRVGILDPSGVGR